VDSRTGVTGSRRRRSDARARLPPGASRRARRGPPAEGRCQDGQRRRKHFQDRIQFLADVSPERRVDLLVDRLDARRRSASAATRARCAPPGRCGPAVGVEHQDIGAPGERSEVVPVSGTKVRAPRGRIAHRCRWPRSGHPRWTPRRMEVAPRRALESPRRKTRVGRGSPQRRGAACGRRKAGKCPRVSTPHDSRVSRGLGELGEWANPPEPAAGTGSPLFGPWADGTNAATRTVGLLGVTGSPSVEMNRCVACPTRRRAGARRWPSRSSPGPRVHQPEAVRHPDDVRVNAEAGMPYAL